MYRRYSYAEKAAYYARKAGTTGYSNYPRRSGGGGIYRSPVPVRTVSGRGDYYTRFRRNFNKPYSMPGLGRRLGSAAGSIIGSAISPGAGSVIGGGVGGALGQLAHAGIKTVTGFGDYKIKANSIMYNRDAAPQFTTKNPRCTIISHSEFIKDVRGSINFAMDTFDINATNPACFPWLSQIAQNFEQVVWQGVIFQFKTTCGNSIASTNTAMGTVVMATQYDSLSRAFANKQQMENYEFAQSSIPSRSILHAIECDPSLTACQGLFYTDSPNNSNNNADPRLYNIGKFNIATVGMQAAAIIGELWVTYKVCLLKPKLVAQSNWSDHWILDPTNLTGSDPFGDNPVLSSTSSSYNAWYRNGSSYLTAADQQLTNLKHNPWPTGLATSDADCYINPSFTGKLVVVYQLHGGTEPKTDPVVTKFGNVTITTEPNVPANPPRDFTTYQKTYGTGTVNADSVMYTFCLEVTGGYNQGGNSPGFKLASGTPGAPTIGNLCIYSVPSNITN